MALVDLHTPLRRSKRAKRVPGCGMAKGLLGGTRINDDFVWFSKKTGKNEIEHRQLIAAWSSEANGAWLLMIFLALRSKMFENNCFKKVQLRQ